MQTVSSAGRPPPQRVKVPPTDATQDELKQRFSLGGEIRGRLRRASVEISWEDQKARFSYILLTNSIAISSLIAALFRLFAR
jgi:hypothetical protein